MITIINADMCEATPEKLQGSCRGCIAFRNSELCVDIGRVFKHCHPRPIIYKLKREYKLHYRTPPANYSDSENDLS